MSAKRRNRLRFGTALVAILLPAAAFADNIPGWVSDAGGTDPTYDIYEGVVNRILAPTVAGDVVLCEFGYTCTKTDTTHYSDVVVFDPHLLYTNITIYSDGDSTYNLSDWLSGNSLSSNTVFLTESLSGVTYYDPNLFGVGDQLTLTHYNFHSPEEPGVPEPTSLAMLFGALAIVGIGTRRRQKGTA